MLPFCFQFTFNQNLCGYGLAAILVQQEYCSDHEESYTSNDRRLDAGTKAKKDHDDAERHEQRRSSFFNHYLTPESYCRRNESTGKHSSGKIGFEQV